MQVEFGKDQVPAAAVAPAPPAPAAPAPVAPPPSATPTPPPPAAAAPLPPPAVANKSNTSLGPTGLVLGDKIPDFQDIILPRINFVQNLGDLRATFQIGAIVLGRQTVIFSPPVIKNGAVETPASKPATIIVLGFRPTKFSEKVAGSTVGLTVNTEADVRANGGTLDYKEWELKKASGMKLFQPLADALVAVEGADDAVFGYEVLGKKYALALWAMKGSAYTEAAKRVFFTGRAVGLLRKGYPTYSFSLASVEKSYPNGNKAWIPVCRPMDKTEPEFLAFVRQVLQAPAEEAAAE